MTFQRYLVFPIVIILVLAGLYVFSHSGDELNLRNLEGFTQDQASAINSNNKTALERGATISSQSRVVGEQTFDPISIQALKQKKFNGHSFTVGRRLEENAVYTKYYVTYGSGELTISGTMSVPKGSVPIGGFPVVFTNHGYIDPVVYTNGRGLRREGAFLAGKGFVVFHSDYRNHAQSDKDVDNDAHMRIGYIEDVINAVYALRASGLSYIHTEKMGMLGHSMGGGIAQGIMVAKPNLIDAFVLYAPVSMNARDSYDRWTVQRPEVTKRIQELHGSPASNPQFWDNISPSSFVHDIEDPVLIFHGTDDQDVPIEWSRRTYEALQSAHKEVEFIEYPGQPHEFTSVHEDFMQKTVQFFSKHLQ